MTGTNRSSADLDPRRRRILYRAWHRGIREMDLVLGQFADAYIGSLSEADLDVLEHIMDEEDNDLVKWITGERPVPDHIQSPMFDRIAAIRPDFDWPRNAVSDGSPDVNLRGNIKESPSE